MKNITLIIAGLLLAGCANLSVQTNNWSMHASTFCKDIQIPEVYVGADGSISVKGYNSTVNITALNNMVNQIISDIITSGIKAYLLK